jgi:predicted small secreted protein
MKSLSVALIALLLAGCNINTSPGDGDKIGQIAKVQRVGMICKTDEILITGKFGGGELHLTVPSNLLSAVQAANESQQFVKVRYHTDFMDSLCSNETGNKWLDSVEAHPAGAPQ